MKEMESDVQQLKAALNQHVGTTWQAASKRIPGTPWTVSQNQRGQAPWREVEAAMTAGGQNAVGTFIAGVARRMTSSYYSFSP